MPPERWPVPAEVQPCPCSITWGTMALCGPVPRRTIPALKGLPATKLPRFLHPTHSIICNWTLFHVRHLFSLGGSFGSVRRERAEPVLIHLTTSHVLGLVGKWEGSCWISAGSISGPQTGRSKPPCCLPTSNLPWPRAGRSCSKTGLMSVIANLWPFLHVPCFFLINTLKRQLWGYRPIEHY